MSTLSSIRDKGTVDQAPRKEYMTYCGEYEMREGGTQHGGDGINGTIVAPQSKIEAAGAGPTEKVRVLVEANGKSVTLERKIHKSGNTLTIPLKQRKKLDLEPGDPIEFWIDEVKEGVEADNDGDEVQKTPDEDVEEESKEFIAIIGESLTYHYLEGKDAGETACGISLDSEDYNVGQNPGDFLSPCHDCKAYSSKPMTNGEIVEWLGDEIGFKQTDGPPAYFNKEQLVAIKDSLVDKQSHLEELEAKNREYRARVARLEQRIQELE